MNANELSDELQDLYKNYCHANAIKEAATMLRQQQAKIDCLLDNNARLDAEIEELQAKEASQYLNAPLTQEPVAIRYDFDGYGYQYMDSGSGSDWQTRVDGEPLYTHPVKELTEGEIHEIAYCHANLLTEVIGFSPKGLMNFANAILRKASEK